MDLKKLFNTWKHDQDQLQISRINETSCSVGLSLDSPYEGLEFNLEKNCFWIGSGVNFNVDLNTKLDNGFQFNSELQLDGYLDYFQESYVNLKQNLKLDLKFDSE